MSKDLKISIIKDLDVSLTSEEINNKIRELEKKISLVKIKHPEGLKKISDEFTRIQKQVNENPYKFSESLRVAFSQFSFYHSYGLPILLNNLYVSYEARINKELKKRIDMYETILKEYDDNLWAVDLETLRKVGNGEVTIKNIEAYIEKQLHFYISYFKKEKFYSKYKLILEQSYYSFKNKHYALAIFPLFAVVENLISRKFHHHEIDAQLKAKIKEKGKQVKLYDKLQDYVESTQDEVAIYLMLFRRVFNTYSKIFAPYHIQGIISRNKIMHGSYNYYSVSKKDILKMFQLIKSIEVIENISFVKEN